MAAPGCRPSGSAGGGPPAQGRDLRQPGLRVCDRHEITRFRPLLDQLGDLRDVVVTVVHCQRNHVTYLAERGAQRIPTVKKTSPACTTVRPTGSTPPPRPAAEQAASTPCAPQPQPQPHDPDKIANRVTALQLEY
jgi:hypothetical protein